METEEIEKILKNHEKRIDELEKQGISKPKTIKKELSIKEFLISKNVKSDVHKTLTIAYYLEKYESYDSFNVIDLKEEFRKAKEPLPSNINQMVNWNIQQGFIMESGNKKEKLKSWTLTNTGEKLVENEFKKTNSEIVSEEK